jgi:SNF2 family DNA or RNA helicase
MSNPTKTIDSRQDNHGIFDNSEANQTIQAIKDQLRHSKNARFAIGYFFLSGFRLLEDDFPKEIIQAVEKAAVDPKAIAAPFLQIVMGNETTRETGEEITTGYELRNQISAEMLSDLQNRELSSVEEENVRRLSRLIQSGLVEIRLFESARLHAKLYLFLTNPDAPYANIGTALVGSSNFTDAGLLKNRELNIFTSDRNQVLYLNQWYDSLWKEATPFDKDLLKIIDIANLNPNQKKEYPKIGTFVSPEKLFRYLVYRWFDGRVGNLLNTDILAEFQITGVLNTVRMLDRFNGAIIADSVGLGKSFIGSAVIEEFIEGKHPTWLESAEKEACVLLLLPPAVILQWELLLFHEEEGYFFRNYEKQRVSDPKKTNDIVYELRLPGSNKKSKIRLLSTGLLQNFNEDSQELFELSDTYDLILLDEAHKFRNATSKRWKVMRRLQKKTNLFQNRILLLTATPVNNSIYDLYNLIRLFNDDQFAPFAEKGVKPGDLFPRYATLRKNLEQKDDAKADKELKSVVKEIQNKILDEVLLLRTRNYIAKNFKNVTINGNPLVFKDPPPDPLDSSAFYSTEFKSFIQSLQDNLEKIHFTHTRIYGVRYILFRNASVSDDVSRESFKVELSDIFRLLLSKRLESSIFAFEVTLRRVFEKENELAAILKERVNHIHDRPSFDSIIQSALLDSGVKQQIDEETTEITETEEEEPVTWLDRAYNFVLEEAREYISRNPGMRNPTNEEEWLRLGVNALCDLMERDLESFAPILQSLDDQKERDSTGNFQALGRLTVTQEDHKERPIFIYKNDPKLEALKQILGRRDQKSPALDKVATLHQCKAILFTGYKDTAQYLFHHLEYWANTSPVAEQWLFDPKKRLKIGIVTGDTGPETRDNLKKRFAPDANHGHKVLEQMGEIDLLVATDAFSEGVNLQDGNAVVNFDLPWNPMIIVQRVGRVNRIGNAKDVKVVNFQPGPELEPMLGLLSKLQRKIKDVSLLLGNESRILRHDEKVEVRTIGERIKKLAELSMTELESMGLHSELSDRESLKESLEADEFKLLNFIQYDLKLNKESFDDVKNLKGPFYSSVEGPVDLISVYESRRGRMKEKFIYRMDSEGKVSVEESPLRFLELIQHPATRPISVILIADQIFHFSEMNRKRIEDIVEETGMEQEGFLNALIRQLDNHFEDLEDSDDPIFQKYAGVRNSLSLVRTKDYSRLLRSSLREADLLEELPGGKIKLREGKTALELIENIFKEERFSRIDFSQEIDHYGWYSGDRPFDSAQGAIGNYT